MILFSRIYSDQGLVINREQSSTVRTVRTLLFEAYVRIFTYAILAKVGLCTSEKYVPDNVGVAAGILFLSAICQKL